VSASNGTAFQAILWDCDGVLIDSEVLACQVAADFYTRAGYSLTAKDYVRRFAGQNRAQIATIIRGETGIDVTGIDWLKKEAARKALFEAQLGPVPGVQGVLKHVLACKVRMAVASGSSLDRLEHSLRLTELWDSLAPHIYSTEQVGRGKPAPDVFLLAADKLAVSPKQCLVVEDSSHGVEAGKAAGMTVYGFTGASHCEPGWGASLTAAGADAVFSCMSDLHAGLGLGAR
jgi:HAD superfamily hydrolase (TIGR01509 family)